MLLHYLLCVWPLLNYILNADSLIEYTYNNTKLKNNIISAFHTSISNITNILYFITYNQTLLQFSSLFSLTYFIWDTYRIILCQNDESLFLIHHIITINLLDKIYNNYYSNQLLALLLIAELSNIPYYIVYYRMKVNKLSNKPYYNKSKIDLIKTIQIYLFIICRVILFTFFSYKLTYLIDDKLLLFELHIIYILGLIWLFNTIKGVYSHKIKNKK